MKLTDKQIEAINHKDGPALILAVPGSGKTTVLIHRANRLINTQGISPNRLLSITFSKSSANDMRQRYINTFPEERFNTPIFSTIHSFCFSIIRDYGRITGNTYRLIEDKNIKENKYQLLKSIYYEINNDYIQEDKMESLLNYIGFIKNMMLTVDDFLEEYDIDIKEFKQIYLKYEKYKRDRNLLDFDDMLTFTLTILKDNPKLLNRYRDRFDYIQVDEGQDTSKLQLEIIKLLAAPKNNIVIVADDDQSIYGFRGAYPEGLLEFNNHFKDGIKFYMEENFRSSKNIVNTSNKFIKINNLRYNKNIFTNNDYLKSIDIIKVDSTNEQYDYILENLDMDNLNNTCILYRNNMSSVGLVEILERNNIPFNTKDSNLKFFNHWVIKDILNILEFSNDDSKLYLYEDFYYKIYGFISRKLIDFAKNKDFDQDSSVFDRMLKSPDRTEFYINKLYDLKYDFKKLNKLKPREAIEFIEYNLEYDDYLLENSDKFGYSYENLNKIIFYLKIIADNCKDITEFKNRLDYIKSLYGKDNHNALTLSTIHSAKGLEFDNVFMIDLIDGEFPNLSLFSKDEERQEKDLEEERRLFYVAMTRARKNLKLITLNQINGKRVYPSDFIKELANIE